MDPSILAEIEALRDMKVSALRVPEPRRATVPGGFFSSTCSFQEPASLMSALADGPWLFECTGRGERGQLTVGDAVGELQRIRAVRVEMATLNARSGNSRTSGELGNAHDPAISRNSCKAIAGRELTNGQRQFEGNSGSSGRTRTYNPSVNSRMLYH